ncbi:HD-GYP domain-containing protein [Azotosporobacter soli]|uniref:HD-GYP domain-containing protein n=1 Tax=Azotosporobacter soli TaxID=3055040 RepID=UPI0031FEEB3E
MFKKPMISIFSIAVTLSSTLNLVMPKMANHNRQVAFIAYLLGAELNFPLEKRKELFLAAVMHDIGAISQQEKMDNMAFEVLNPHRHSEIGYRLLCQFPPFAAIADIVRFHHVRWADGEGIRFNGHDVSEASHIIHFADRIAVMLPEQSRVLGAAKRIVEEIDKYRGSWFKPEFVDAFTNLAGREHFWLDATAASPTETLLDIVNSDSVEFDIALLQGLSRIFAQIIDFRSSFTATHSAGVAASAEILAQLAGFSENELLMMRMAGHLHDLGKVTVPTSILEKPGKLSTEEWDIMRAHTYHGFRTLQKIPILETVNTWGSLHHEKLNGSGYPFHLTADELPLGSRIMAVADIFAALTENRPYREGMQPKQALQIISGMAKAGEIDTHLVALLQENLKEIDACRQAAVGQATTDYWELFRVSNF